MVGCGGSNRQAGLCTMRVYAAYIMMPFSFGAPSVYDPPCGAWLSWELPRGGWGPTPMSMNNLTHAMRRGLAIVLCAWCVSESVHRHGGWTPTTMW